MNLCLLISLWHQAQIAFHLEFQKQAQISARGMTWKLDRSRILEILERFRRLKIKPLHSLACLYFSAFYYCLSCLVFLTKFVFVFSMSFCVFLMGLFRPLFGCIYNRFKHILCSKNCGLQRDLILDCRNRRPARWPSPRPIYLSDRESFFLFRCIGLIVLLL